MIEWTDASEDVLPLDVWPRCPKCKQIEFFDIDESTDQLIGYAHLSDEFSLRSILVSGWSLLRR